jgi:hypothetical protein
MSWKQAGSLKIFAFVATKIEVSLKGQGKKVSFTFSKTSGSFAAGGGPVVGEWFVNPKDLPSKVRMRFGGAASGGGGALMQFVDRNDETKLLGQFAAQVGGFSASMIDDNVKLKKG